MKKHRRLRRWGYGVLLVFLLYFVSYAALSLTEDGW
jgi:hypothetical protein